MSANVKTEELIGDEDARLSAEVPGHCDKAVPYRHNSNGSSTEIFQSVQVGLPAEENPSLLQGTDLLSPQIQYALDLPRPPPVEEVEDSSMNVEFQDVWEESMEGVGTTGTPHKKTAVLMVTWTDELDELKTGPEVDELANVFRNKFHYEVVPVELKANSLPAHQLMVELAKFIEKYDTESTLLIIYYAGHGIGGQPGELYFASKKTNSKRTGIPKNSIPWHSMEAQFQLAQGDILLIFDCCYAGNLDAHLDSRGHWATRSFEFLAACKHDARTHPPGPKSFTRALIWSLENLLETRGKFSTHELQMKFQNAKGFPKNQVVRIIDRGDPSDHRLVLAALPTDADSAKTESIGPKPSANLPKKFIDLRFWYTTCPNEEKIKALANNLRRLIHDGNIQANRVAWVRLGHVDRVRNIINKWKSLPRRRATPKLPTLSVKIPASISDYIPPLHTPPPSQSEFSAVSEAHLEQFEPPPESDEALQGPKVMQDANFGTERVDPGVILVSFFLFFCCCIFLSDFVFGNN